MHWIKKNNKEILKNGRKIIGYVGTNNWTPFFAAGSPSQSEVITFASQHHKRSKNEFIKILNMYELDILWSELQESEPDYSITDDTDVFSSISIAANFIQNLYELDNINH
jgi:hypothetical protein